MIQSHDTLHILFSVQARYYIIFYTKYKRRPFFNLLSRAIIISFSWVVYKNRVVYSFYAILESTLLKTRNFTVYFYSDRRETV